MYEYKAKLLRVVDGDTCHLEIDLGLETYRRIVVRLARINAPEMKTPEGPIAKQYLAGLLEPEKDSLIVQTIKDTQEKYGRYLVEIVGSHGNVNDAMLAGGMAVPYK